jgi:hypothetical protein
MEDENGGRIAASRWEVRSPKYHGAQSFEKLRGLGYFVFRVTVTATQLRWLVDLGVGCIRTSYFVPTYSPPFSERQEHSDKRSDPSEVIEATFPLNVSFARPFGCAALPHPPPHLFASLLTDSLLLLLSLDEITTGLVSQATSAVVTDVDVLNAGCARVREAS